MRLPRVLRLVVALLPSSLPVAAQQQVVLPVFRQSPASPTLIQSRCTVDIDRINGCPYVSIAQMAGALDGHLRWRPIAHTVELLIRGHKVSFAWNSSYVHLGETRVRLEQPAVKTEEGLMVPVSFFARPEFFSAVGSRIEWTTERKAVPERSAPAPAPAPEIRTERPVTPPPPVTVPPLELPKARAVPVVRLIPRPPPSHLHAVRRIVIDPGHGGKDPGTVGLHGVEEKTLNLAFAQTLAELLRERDGYEVLLTRTDDTFIPLARRAGVANQWHADLFVSIHCNASLSAKLKGFEVYFLSEKASDAHADAVARTENASLELEDRQMPLRGPLKALLRSLVKNANINDSSALGTLMDHQVNRHLKTDSLGVQQAGFYVLRGAEMPAVLVETGFLSNPREEQALQNSVYRRRLMEDLSVSIETYDKRKQQERR